MQDVFPIVFEFKRGEQPTAEKLTGLVKHTDVAFSRMNQAIGDPWDYSYHVDSGTTEYLLSPTNLAINNVARFEGPSDYASPIGGCWNEKAKEAIVIKLNPGRNSWSLGFPLVKTITDISPTSISDAGTTLDVLDWSTGWSTDVTIADDPDNVLTTQVAKITLVVADGDFFVDSFRGVITAYSIAETDPIILTINANTFNMFGAGVPWGTHNVIPTWEETSSFCTVAGPTVITTTQDSWLLTLPEVVKNSRTLSEVAIETPYPQEADLGAGADVSWYESDGSTPLTVPGYSSDYRLPQSISGIASGTTLPEGFCQLWDDIGGRFIPLVEFVTLRTTNTLTLLTPTGWLTSSKYRLVVTGTSLAENVNYLNSVVRSGHYAGLVNIPALSYLPPISHNNLSHRYSGSIPPSGSVDYDEYRLKFTESTLPLNPHSQYLHRYGYHAGDEDGNSANAMRGNLVFTGSDANMSLDNGINSAYSSYGIMFGGGDSTDAYWRNATISLWGMTSDSWTTGYPSRHFPANVPETGMASQSFYETTYGALTVHPALGSSLYVRGFYDNVPNTVYGINDYERGASIALDMGQWGEYNHIKVSIPIHDNADYEAANMPANTGQSYFTTELLITPSLDDRLSPYQIREFRFRGGAYIPAAANKATGSLGVLSGLKTSSGAGEFDAYFTSPGMVGCDFLNIYSNAIFFSDTGDGKRTSFTEQGEDWLQLSSVFPSGIYFIPRDGAVNPYFQFVDYDSMLSTSNISTSFGYSRGFYYNGVGTIDLRTTVAANICGVSGAYMGTSTDGTGAYLGLNSTGSFLRMGTGSMGSLTLSSSVGNVNVTASGTGGSVNVSATGTGGDVNITSAAAIAINATRDITLDSTDDILFTAADDITLTATGGTTNKITLVSDHEVNILGLTEATFAAANLTIGPRVEINGDPTIYQVKMSSSGSTPTNYLKTSLYGVEIASSVMINLVASNIYASTIERKTVASGDKSLYITSTGKIFALLV
jgi:hypothetical protein